MKVIVVSTADPETRYVIYETNFSVGESIHEEFLSYLKVHMREIVDLDDGKLFDRATLCEVEGEGTSEPGKGDISVQYRAKSKWKLQEYFDRHGERLRMDMTNRFGGSYTVSRRILTIDSHVERPTVSPV